MIRDLCDACPCTDLGYCWGGIFCERMHADPAKWAARARQHTLRDFPEPPTPRQAAPGARPGYQEALAVFEVATDAQKAQADACTFWKQVRTCCDDKAKVCTGPGSPWRGKRVLTADCLSCVIGGHQPKGASDASD